MSIASFATATYTLPHNLCARKAQKEYRLCANDNLPTERVDMVWRRMLCQLNILTDSLLDTLTYQNLRRTPMPEADYITSCRDLVAWTRKLQSGDDFVVGLPIPRQIEEQLEDVLNQIEGSDQE